MRVVILVLLAVIAITSALPENKNNLNLKSSIIASNNQRNNGLENLVRELLEFVRDIMLNGSGNIPVLDPFHHERFYIDLSILGLYGSYVNIEEISSRGLASFETPDLSLRMSSLFPIQFTLFMTLELPAIEAKASLYDFNLDVLGFKILYGKGSMSFAATRPRATIIAIVSPNLSGGISLSIADLTVIIRTDTFEPHITGLFNDNHTSYFICSFLKNFIPATLEMYEKDITNFISPLLMELLNGILQDLDLSNLISPSVSEIKVQSDTSRLAY